MPVSHEFAFERLWVVEDSAPLRAVVMQLLSGLARHVEGAGCVAECEALLQASGVPNAIVCDHDLPDGTGIGVAALFSRAERPHLVALTASNDPEVHQALKASGFVIVLQKPVRGPDLRQALNVKAQPTAESDIPAELQERYARFVAEETRAIAAAYAALSGPKLIHHLHKLAGTASVYGDKALARAASACEARLRDGEPLAWLRRELTELFESAGGPARLAS
jgi:two-component system, NarL family, sensor histidine kinase EvgS